MTHVRRTFPVMCRVLDDGAEGDDGIVGRDHGSGGRVETFAQGENAQAEALLRFQDVEFAAPSAVPDV